ncbi:MAG: Hpt domain-containing protein [Planctomycetes bacterium]|nr:Hpt domain-containing protein [Planctomycetota bacterium]
MDYLLSLDEMLRRFDGDRDALNEVIQVFLEECPKLVSEVRAAVVAKDAGRLDRSAHTLKGAASNFSAQAAALALELEGMGRSGDLRGAGEAFMALEAQVSEIVPALATLAAQPVEG